MMKVQVVRSFTAEEQGGNPAGVVLEAEGLTEEKMQQIAKEVALSETAFVTGGENGIFQVRFFTPVQEIPLCGHATIASFGCLFQKGRIKEGSYTQETKAGTLGIRVEKDGLVWMEQAPLIKEEVLLGERILKSLSLKEEDIDWEYPPAILSTGVRDLFIGVKDEQRLEACVPNFEEIEKISMEKETVGYHVYTVRSQRGDGVSRNFAPLYGILEESATGTSNGALGAYLVSLSQREKNQVLTMWQGIWMNEPSQILASVSSENIVWVAGRVFVGEEILLKDLDFQ